MKEMLTASHIKPWRLRETAEDWVSVSNGLLVGPTLDRLFDHGLITFDEKFKIRISSQVSLAHQRYFGIDSNTRLRLRDFDDLKPFLQWHEAHHFQHWYQDRAPSGRFHWSIGRHGTLAQARQILVP